MLNSRDLKYKEYLKLQKRSNDLYDQLRNLPNVKLDKPYQSGWTIEYDVREDIKRRIDYPIIKEALDRGYGITYTKNVKVVRAIRKKDKNALIKNRWSSSIISSYYPQRNYLSDEEYKISNNISKYFELDTTSERYTKYHRMEYKCVFPSYWLVLKVKPNMITHRYIKGGEIEKEYEYLRDKLWHSGEFFPFIVNYGKSYPAFKDRAKTRSKIRKFLNGEQEDIFNDKIPLEYEY